MFVYRIEKQKFLPTIFEGIGGKNYDFRWNNKGYPIIYASESKSLALHEKAANLSSPSHRIPSHYVIAVIEIPDFDYPKILPASLPQNWNDITAYHPETQRIGNEFVLSDQLAIVVPSTLIPGEFNVLLNPKAIKKHDVSLSTELINDRLVDSRNQSDA